MKHGDEQSLRDGFCFSSREYLLSVQKVPGLIPSISRISGIVAQWLRF